MRAGSDRGRRWRGGAGASLLEMLVSMVVLSLLMVWMVQVLSGAMRVWTLGREKMGRFKGVREGISVMEDRLSQVMAGNRWEYEYEGVAPAIPRAYVVASELRFRSGVAAWQMEPTGDRQLRGHAVSFVSRGRGHGGGASEGGSGMRGGAFFVAYGEERGGLEGMERKRRYRLYETSEPLRRGVDGGFEVGWRSRAVERAWVVAENVVLLVVVPMRETIGDEAPVVLGCRYDSADWGHEVPPQVRILMVGIDEGSAERLEAAGMLEDLVPEGWFDEWENGEDLEAELAALRRRLDGEMGMRVGYQIFDRTVAIPASGWNS
jgi:hypothetical protein